MVEFTDLVSVRKEIQFMLQDLSKDQIYIFAHLQSKILTIKIDSADL